MIKLNKLTALAIALFSICAMPASAITCTIVSTSAPETTIFGNRAITFTTTNEVCMADPVPVNDPNIVDINDIPGYASLPTEFSQYNTGEHPVASGFLGLTDDQLNGVGNLNQRGGAYNDVLDFADARKVLRRYGGKSTTHPRLQPQDFHDGYLFAYKGTDFAYAGLLPSTNMGAPIASTEPSAVWTAQMYHNLGSSPTVDGIAFLNVYLDFGKGELFISEPITLSHLSGNYMTVDGSFNAQGAISGTLDINYRGRGDTSIDPIFGEISGLIGTRGLVAVVHGTSQSGATAFAGGMIVRR